MQMSQMDHSHAVFHLLQVPLPALHHFITSYRGLTVLSSGMLRSFRDPRDTPLLLSLSRFALRDVPMRGQSNIHARVGISFCVHAVLPISMLSWSAEAIGRTGLRRALLGSVAETVAKEAPCSVLIVRRHPRDRLFSETP